MPTITFLNKCVILQTTCFDNSLEHIQHLCNRQNRFRTCFQSKQHVYRHLIKSGKYLKKRIFKCLKRVLTIHIFRILTRTRNQLGRIIGSRFFSLLTSFKALMVLSAGGFSVRRSRF